ncbi:hypothetical protein [Streptosporangium sp. NPDC006007]
MSSPGVRVAGRAGVGRARDERLLRGVKRGRRAFAVRGEVGGGVR